MFPYKLELKEYNAPIIEAESPDDAIRKLFSDAAQLGIHIRLEAVPFVKPSDDGEKKTFRFAYHYRKNGSPFFWYDHEEVMAYNLEDAYEKALYNITRMQGRSNAFIYSITDDKGVEYKEFKNDD